MYGRVEGHLGGGGTASGKRAVVGGGGIASHTCSRHQGCIEEVQMEDRGGSVQLEPQGLGEVKRRWTRGNGQSP